MQVNHLEFASESSSINVVLPDQEEKQRLLNSEEQSHCVIEVIFDDADKPIDYRFLDISESFERHTGLRNARGQRMRELKADHEQHWFDQYGKVSLTGDALHFVAEAAALKRWYDVYAFRLDPLPKGRVIIVFRDITRDRRDEEHYSLMRREIQHRARNVITLLSGIARMTHGDTVADYKKRLLERFQGMARVEAALSSDPSGLTDYASVVRNELTPYATGEDRISILGPSVMIDGRSARCYAMVLHELATNAVKYGAWSAPEGKISVTWRVEGGNLRTVWEETGGPATRAPEWRGVGSTVIERCIHSQLDGRLNLDWRVEGLCCEFDAPVFQPGSLAPD